MLRSMTVPDPASFFRQMLGEWEKMANNIGGQVMQSDEWSRTMHGAQSAQLQAQAATKAMMERALAAANMPSRAEVEDLSARMGRIEASLARIEAALLPAATPVRPKPTRGRKPPEVA